MEKVKITVISEGFRKDTTDFVTAEVPLTIEVNQKEMVTLLCSPVDLKELVLGFLYTSGFIRKPADLKKLIIDQQRWKAAVEIDPELFPEKLLFKRLYTSGCGKGIIFYNPLTSIHRRLSSKSTFPGKNIIELMKKFQKSSPEFKETGGVHSAGLCDREKILVLADDIGRHNALDKVIGKALLTKINFEDKMALITGRISSEILFKIQHCGIPAIASSSAPTDQAVKLAKKADITLVGFVRGNRLNVYSGEKRIT